MFKRPWLVWVVVGFGEIFEYSQWRALHQNCQLVECQWSSPSSILLGLAAFGVALIWYFVGKPEDRGGWSAFFNGAAVLASIHLIAYGFGLVGPSPCPEIDPNCL